MFKRLHHFLRRAGLFLALGLLTSACSRQGATAVTESDGPPPDYHQILDRTRARQEATGQIDDMRLAIARFQQETGRTPNNLLELVRHNYMTSLPEPPPGFVIRYNPTHGNVDMVNTQRVARTEHALPEQP